MKRLLTALLFLLPLAAASQVDSAATLPQPSPDTESVQLRLVQAWYERDSIYDQLMLAQRRVARLDRLNDSLVINNERFQRELEEKNRLLEDKNRALRQKDSLASELQQLYRELLSATTVDRARLEAEISAKQAYLSAKDREIEVMQRGIDDKQSSIEDQKAAYERLAVEKERMRRMVDSLATRCIEMDKEIVRKQEENKFLAQKAKEAEDKVSTATNRKKKVRPIQGIAMRFYRTPDWIISLSPKYDEDGTTTTYERVIRNRNEGNMEFDFITGASVMLWDLTPVFNKPDTTRKSLTDIPKFDQQFSYDLGLHVAFGGSNLFKNFYVGPSFRFMDFFYLTAGVNICEFEVLRSDVPSTGIIDNNWSMTDVICKKWLVKPFLSFSIDLDFLSYIKR